MAKLNYERHSDICKALGHPVRFRIVAGLLENECSVSHIVEKLKLPQSSVSQQLAILRNKGIITPRKDGVRCCYQVVDADVKKIIAALKR